jgi:hypothetical protein
LTVKDFKKFSKKIIKMLVLKAKESKNKSIDYENENGIVEKKTKSHNRWSRTSTDIK